MGNKISNNLYVEIYKKNLDLYILYIPWKIFLNLFFSVCIHFSIMRSKRGIFFVFSVDFVFFFASSICQGIRLSMATQRRSGDTRL